MAEAPGRKRLRDGGSSVEEDDNYDSVDDGQQGTTASPLRIAGDRLHSDMVRASSPAARPRARHFMRAIRPDHAALASCPALV